MVPVLPLRTAWIRGYPFASVPARCTHCDNAVGNVVAETGRDGGTTTRLSDRSVNAISALCVAVERRGVGLWRDDGLMLSPFVEHTSVWEGVGGRGKIWRGIPQWNTKLPKDQLSKPQTATVVYAQWPTTCPNNPGERTASAEQVLKKGIKLILKTIGNRKGDCAWSCLRWQKQSEKIC